ncbi:MAG: AAA family ATPase [Sulfobacillus sp.]
MRPSASGGDPVGALLQGLAGAGYVAGPDLATAVHLALTLPRPLLVEGPAGVGKTALATALSSMLGRRLVRLQCFEGLDFSQALYEWDYPRQLLALRQAEGGVDDADLFSARFLLHRPLLSALLAEDGPVVLLIDEIDRADEALEALLLELLGEGQVTIPELGTLKAKAMPHVVITSNRTRELSDALRRRCLYAWIDFPTVQRESAILAAHLPKTTPHLAAEVARLMAALRRMELDKPPGVAEALDLAAAAAQLGADHLDQDVVARALGTIVKSAQDRQRLLAADGQQLAQALAEAEES